MQITCFNLSLIVWNLIARAGVPMEVMGLLLGEFPDDTIEMLQSGTAVSVEAIDDALQTKMLDMVKQTGQY